MADFTQAPLDDNITHQEVTHSAVVLASVVGTEEVVTSGEMWTTIHMHHAFIEAGANTNPASFFVQTNLAATGSDESWVTVAQFTVTNATTVEEDMTATEAAGVTELAIASSTGFANGDYIYIRDTTTVADSEWQQIAFVTATPTINIHTPGLETGKDSADEIWSDAETFTMILDLSGVGRWRVVYMNQGAAAMNTAIWVRFITTTDFV